MGVALTSGSWAIFVFIFTRHMEELVYQHEKPRLPYSKVSRVVLCQNYTFPFFLVEKLELFLIGEICPVRSNSAGLFSNVTSKSRVPQTDGEAQKTARPARLGSAPTPHQGLRGPGCLGPGQGRGGRAVGGVARPPHEETPARPRGGDPPRGGFPAGVGAGRVTTGRFTHTVCCGFLSLC